MKKALFRWTIGETNKTNLKSLKLSIESFLKFYDADVIICHNSSPKNINLKYDLFDQRIKWHDLPEPKGVAWKLYPPRLDIHRHELCIDNDVIIESKVEEIEIFLKSNKNLLLEGNSRTYGRFEKHVPENFCINSGIYGMPPGFNFEKYVKFYCGEKWEKNALNQHDKNETFDEQGIVALSLLNENNFIIIPNDKIVDCQYKLQKGLGYHFIGLNRRKIHYPFQLYNLQRMKIL